MDSRDILIVALGFFLMAIAMEFVPVLMKAYKNWKS
jgi:hypothetical protein